MQAEVKFLTQTNLDPGNCWQTCVAVLLGVEPETLPDQSICDLRDLVHCDCPPPGCGRKHRQWREGTPSYNNRLQDYLRVHHGLGYWQTHIDARSVSAVLAVREPGWHMITGNTVRTAENRSRHVVIGRYGEVVWDPHPSRAGLLDDGEREFGFIIPRPPAWDTLRPGREHDPCVCPACLAARAPAA